ncbi:immunity protein Imm33 domain-containing protein [Micromonospora sp. URMC 103]|uniref:immunity protein Imm33 domain-containing protein n=1 Tax=Micromonospora sp. URMC 103 TaxID=3423406 RepID=UPI003F1BF3AB
MGDMIRWRRRMPGLDVSAAQRDICRRFRVESAPPKQRTAVGLALSRPRHLEPLNALRHATAGASNDGFVWRRLAIHHEEDKIFAPLHVEHLDEYARQLACSCWKRGRDRLRR